MDLNRWRSNPHRLAFRWHRGRSSISRVRYDRLGRLRPGPPQPVPTAVASSFIGGISFNPNCF